MDSDTTSELGDRKLKIAFIGGRGLVGTYSGIETYYDEVGSRLVTRGHEVTAYCRTHFTPDVDSYHGIQVRRLPSLRSKHLETISHSLLATLDCLRRDFDIVQYHAIGSAPLAWLPRMVGHTTIASVRGLDWQRAKWSRVARAVLQMGEWASARIPHATVVVSETLADHYEEVYGKRPFVVVNAINFVDAGDSGKMEELGLQRDSFFLFAGRISPEKGVHTLLEALRPLDRRRKKLVIAGGSSYSQDYIDELKRNAWDEVIFLGSVEHGVVQELFSNCYAYVLPSEMEGLSIALLEALSHGTCIVTTNIPENVEVVADSALTFAPGDVAELRAHLESLVESPDLVAKMRSRARQRAKELPDWDAVASQTEELYRRLLRQRSGNAPTR